MINKDSSNLKIIGENIIMTRSHLSAIYVIPGFNYIIKKSSSINAHIDKLYNLVKNMFKETKELKFCLSKMDIPITRSENMDYIRESMRKWTTEDIKIDEFIERGNYSQFILEVFLEEQKDNQSIDIKEVIKESLEGFYSLFTPNISGNLDRIFTIESNYANILSVNGAKRASRDIVFRYILQNYFPGYSFPINLKNLSYNLLLKNIDQFFQFKMGYFITQNEFLTTLGLKAIEKYNTILQYTEFPEKVDPDEIYLLSQGTKIFIKIGDQNKLKKAVKRKSGDIKFQLEAAEKAETTDTSEDEERLDLVDLISYRLNKGEIGCEACIVQMISANSKQELDVKKKKIMVDMFNKDISCYSILNQNKAFNEFFKIRRPQNYNFLSDLKYMLSMKIDNFSNVGDFDSKDSIGLIKIGETL